MVFCIPLVALEPFLGQTLSRLSHRRRAEDPRARAVLEQSIRRASVALSVRLPEFQVSMRALSSMEVGQVLLSGHPSEIPLELHVGGYRRFRGSPGQIRKTLGVQIVDCLGADQGISVAPPRGRVV
jgi:flagellar motor switch protein FliM